MCNRHHVHTLWSTILLPTLLATTRALHHSVQGFGIPWDYAWIYCMKLIEMICLPRRLFNFNGRTTLRMGLNFLFQICLKFHTNSELAKQICFRDYQILFYSMRVCFHSHFILIYMPNMHYLYATTGMWEKIPSSWSGHFGPTACIHLWSNTRVSPFLTSIVIA